MASRSLVLDANILIRAVLGQRVRRIVETHDTASFFVPESAYFEAEEHLSALVIKRGGDPLKALELLAALAELCELIGPEIYAAFELGARERLGTRDPDDLADPCFSTRPWLSHLDRRRRLFRMRGRHLDVQSGRNLFTPLTARLATGTFGNMANHLVTASVTTAGFNGLTTDAAGNIVSTAPNRGARSGTTGPRTMQATLRLNF